MKTLIDASQALGRALMLPIAVPMVVVVSMLQFTGIWNDFLLGLVFAAVVLIVAGMFKEKQIENIWFYTADLEQGRALARQLKIGEERVQPLEALGPLPAAAASSRSRNRWRTTRATSST